MLIGWLIDELLGAVVSWLPYKGHQRPHTRKCANYGQMQVAGNVTFFQHETLILRHFLRAASRVHPFCNLLKIMSWGIPCYKEAWLKQNCPDKNEILLDNFHNTFRYNDESDRLGMSCSLGLIVCFTT